MFTLDHAGVEQKYYDSRIAVVCSLAPIPRDLFEELKAVSDAWSVFQEAVPTTCIWGWHKSQRCQVAHSGVARYSMIALRPVKCCALSTAEVVFPVPMPCDISSLYDFVTELVSPAGKLNLFPSFSLQRIPCMHPGQSLMPSSLHPPLISCPAILLHSTVLDKAD